MTLAGELLSLPWILKTGTVLVHFLWQGAAVAAVLAVALALLRRRTPQVRWLAACLALAVLALAPLATACVVFYPAGTPEAADPFLAMGEGVAVDLPPDIAAPPAVPDRPPALRPTAPSVLPASASLSLPAAAPAPPPAPWADRASRKSRKST